MRTRKLELPHLIAETIYAGEGEPGAVFTPGGLQGTYELVRDSGLGQALAGEGFFVGWDRRFAPNSVGPFCLQSFESNAFDLLHVMDAFEMKRPNVIGSSYGASVSLTFAFWMPERVNKLVLMNPARISGPQSDRERAERTECWRGQLREKGVRAMLQSGDFCYSFSPDRDDLAGGRVGDMDPEEFGVVVEETQRRMGTSRLPVLGVPESMIRFIKHRALVVRGGDEIHKPEVGEHLAEILPNARLARSSATFQPECIEEIISFLRE